MDKWIPQNSETKIAEYIGRSCRGNIMYLLLGTLERKTIKDVLLSGSQLEGTSCLLLQGWLRIIHYGSSTIKREEEKSESASFHLLFF